MRNETARGGYSNVLIEELQAMVNAVSNLLDEMHSDTWEAIEEVNINL